MLIKSWKALMIFSIIVPISLLAAFRITGMTHGPATVSDNIALGAATLEIERPDHDESIVDYANVEAYYEKDIRLAQGIELTQYAVNFLDGSDIVRLIVNSTATLEAGFVRSVNITFWEDYEYSYVDIDNVQAWPTVSSHLENLTVVGYGYLLHGNGLKDYVELGCMNESRNVHIDGLVNWFLHSPQNRTHVMEVEIETTYYNGTGFNRIVQPFKLEIGPDDNNLLQTAMEIHEGNYSGLYLGTVDNVDFYKIHADSGQKIRIYVDTLDSGFFNLTGYLYDSEGKLVKTSEPLETDHTIEFTSNYTGYWYLKLQAIGGWGFYRMEIRE